jgi:hypothetical protein
MEISELIGLTLSDVSGENSDDQMFFTSEDGRKFKMYHYQECCESVYIEDICGDIQDLIGSPILVAEENSKTGHNDWGTSTWTYYKIDTAKGGITVRWFGQSNGYYSESVNFTEVTGSE